MISTVVIASIIASAVAFAPASRVHRSGALSMSAESLPGAIPPFGYFDPLGLSKGKSDFELKKWREAEIKVWKSSLLSVFL